MAQRTVSKSIGCGFHVHVNSVKGKYFESGSERTCSRFQPGMATIERQPDINSSQGFMSIPIPLQFDPELNDTTLFAAVYCFIRNFVGAANKHSSVIDNKIEKAMDLVKSHLMYTVREEVEVLKLRIAELLDRINQLEMENSFLRANASMDVLNALNSRTFQPADDGTKSVEVEDGRVIPTQ